MAFYISRYKKRKEITFDVEVITPMFLGSADQNKAELRAPSIKGMMRFWWRAVRADADLKKMINEESSIFGGAGDNYGKSSFSVRLHSVRNKRIGKDFLEEIGKEHNGKRITYAQNFGLGYLFYSTYTLKNRGVTIKRPYIRPGTKFMLTFSTGKENVLDHVIGSFWLLVNFGGLGTRARRGGGCLSITGINCDESQKDELERYFMGKDNIADFLVNGYKEAKAKICPQSKNNNTSAYSTLSGSRFVVNPTSQHSDWKSALNEIGLQYREYRLSVKNKLFIGPNFGFPVMHHRFRTRMIGRTSKETLERRSSPLIIKTIRVNGVYYPLVIVLGGRLLPTDGKIVKDIKQNNRWVYSGQSSNENLNHITAFLKTLGQKGYTTISL